MKTFILLIIACLGIFPFVLKGQTAEDIIARTEKVYLELDNYVDYGVSTRYSYSNAQVSTNSQKYRLAVDDQSNIFHSVHSQDGGISREFRFSKSSHDSIGVYQRIHGDNLTTLNCPLPEAAARLGGVGDGILHMVSSLMYEDLYPETYPSGSVLRNYDHATRLSDTILNEEDCYVLQLMRTIEITQDKIVMSEKYRDSVRIAENNFYEYPPDEPHTTKLETKYYLRKEDNIIIRRQSVFSRDNGLTFKSVLDMNPDYNVPNMDEYWKKLSLEK